MIDNSNIKYWEILRFNVVSTRHKKTEIKKVDFRGGIMENMWFCNLVFRFFCIRGKEHERRWSSFFFHKISNG